jgi:hypothetical protein
MNSPAPGIDAAQFQQIAAKCKWSERSLDVAKALIVDGVPLSEAAAAHQMSPQQANVIRGRFLAKAEQARVEAFMEREKPKQRANSDNLKPFATQMQTLRDKGYTNTQIVAFLKENGVTTSPAIVRKFFKEHWA